MAKSRSKKPRKKRNPLTFKAQAGKRYILAATSNHPNRVFGRSGKMLEGLTKFELSCLLDIRHKWTVHCAVLCRDEQGKNYTADTIFDSTDPYYQDELIEIFEREHNKLIKTVNRKHIIKVAWIAAPFFHDMEKEFTDRIYEQIDGWGGQAFWEIES